MPFVTYKHSDGREAEMPDDPETVAFWTDLGWKPAKSTAAAIKEK